MSLVTALIDLMQDSEKREALLDKLDETLDIPLLALAFIWLWMMIYDLTVGWDPWMETLSYAIWALFILDFFVELILATDRKAYLHKHWPTAVAIILPAFRVLKAFKAFKVLKISALSDSMMYLRVATTLRRAKNAIIRTLGRSGGMFMMFTTLAVLMSGSLLMLLLEPHLPNLLEAFPRALWKTLVLMSTLGTNYFPKTSIGKATACFLVTYAMTVYGYLAAILLGALFNVEADADD